MRFTVDRNIPFIQSPLSALGPVTALPGDAITPQVMAATDVLFTRTRTRCGADLLEGSPCRFIGTATIGTDHIDLDWCAARGITVANAPGCNAPAVAQWVAAAIRQWLGPGKSMGDVTLGVIGAGNVGSLVIRWARSLGMEVLVNDPPLQAADPQRHSYASLGEIAARCNAITVHTPLTADGPWPTHHLIDSVFVGRLGRSPLVLNAARGAVTDTRALLDGLADGHIGALAIDCWEGEPDINLQLLEKAMVATPHIAGYSTEGKVRATAMVLDAWAAWAGLAPAQAPHPDAAVPPPVPQAITEDMVRYDIMADTRRLKSSPSSFELQRNTYPLRHEPHA